MPGPAPNPQAVRRNARVGPLRLPAEGRQGPPPAWPFRNLWPTEEPVWQALWATPQAVAWEQMGSGMVRAVARFVRLGTAVDDGTPDPRVFTALQQLEDRLGLNPKAMRTLMWEVVGDELAARRPAAASDMADIRQRIRAVG